VGLWASAAAAASAGALVAILALARAGRVPVRAAHPVGALVAGIALANSALLLAALGDPLQTTNFVLLVVGVGLFFLSQRWLAIVALTSVGVWSLVAFRAEPDPAWTHFGFALLSALVISVAVHAARLKTFRRLERMRIENERQRAEIASGAERLRSVVESAPIVLLAVDREGVVTLVEGAGLNALPDRLQGARGARLTELAGENARFAAAARRALAGESFTVVEELHGAAFEARWMPVRDETGAVAGAIAVATDVTSRREAEALRELDRFKTQFVSMAAHELGTPLTPIRVQAHLLRQSRTLSDADRRSLGILDRNVSRLVALVEDLLDAARVQAGRLAITRSRQDLHAIVADAVESFREAAKHAGIELESRAEPGLAVEVDAKRLSQVVFNLITNALKFTPAGGRLTVDARTNGPSHFGSNFPFVLCVTTIGRRRTRTSSPLRKTRCFTNLS
jgi:signal transduction histidine kinase